MSKTKLIRPKRSTSLVKMERLNGNPETTCSKSSYGNLWVHKVTLASAGATKPSHKHEFDHMHFLVSGKAKITFIDKTKTRSKTLIVTAPEWVEIPKDTEHYIEALVDNTVGFCIHAVRNSLDQVIGSHLGAIHFPDTNLREAQ